MSTEKKLILFCLLTVSSPPKEWFGIRVLFGFGGNHFYLIFILTRKNNQLMSLDFMT